MGGRAASAIAAHIAGVGLTRFGRHEGSGAVELMAQAAQAALADAALAHDAIDGLLCGYATTLPHLMLSTLFAERFGLQPAYAHSVQLGGATGAALVMLAGDLVRAGRCRRVLVVAGENRLTGQSRDAAIQTLAQVGDAELEVPNGGSVPSYYALMASMYQRATGTTEADLAELAVCMRRHAQAHPGAHLQQNLTTADVLASRPIATPLKLADCCPISDGAAAFVVSADAGPHAPVQLIGAGQAHRHQHLIALADVRAVGAAEAADRALQQAGLTLADIGHLGLYDSFTITLAMLLEELGVAPAGQSGRLAREGVFGRDGRWPLNLHGGLLSYGHCGVAGGMAHLAEAVIQLRGQAGQRQARAARHALVHADGGVMSSHVSLVLRAPDTAARHEPDGVLPPVSARRQTDRRPSAAAAAVAMPTGPVAHAGQGGDTLTFQCCRHCGHVPSGRRLVCPACGSEALQVQPASGVGRIVALSTVFRAPTDAWRAAAPYTLVLVDLDEGVRVMAHAAPGLGMGDGVRLERVAVAGHPVWRCRPQAEPAGARPD